MSNPVPPPRGTYSPGGSPPPAGGQPQVMDAQVGNDQTDVDQVGNDRSGRSRLLAILGAVVVALAVIGLKFGLGVLAEDKAEAAKAGDCVAVDGKAPTKDGETTNPDAELVDCASAAAKYTVVGRVEGESDTESKSCDRYFTEEKAEYFVYASKSGSGYLLCLQERA